MTIFSVVSGSSEPQKTYPFCELRVHHEVMDVLLGAGELQLSGDDGH